MAVNKHDVWIDESCLHVKKGGLVIKVKYADKIVGTLKVSDTRVWWTPNGSQVGKGLTWAEFDAQMKK